MHDPYLECWPELENQDEEPSQSRARFFSRQAGLASLPIETDMWAAMRGSKALIFAVRHSSYLCLDPDGYSARLGRHSQ